MKLIDTDNLNRETIADHLWLENISEDQWERAQRLCDYLNRTLGDGPGSFFKLVPDDHRLSLGMDDIV